MALEDSLYQILTEPQEFSMLNLDRLTRFEIPLQDKSGDVLHAVNIDLDGNIQIEQRVVTSLPSFFGEIGGLRDFFQQTILLLIGSC